MFRLLLCDRFLLYLGCGAFFWASIAFVAALNQQFPFLEPDYFIYHFQTLISGISALVVGGLTIWTIKKQMKQTEELAEMQIEQAEKERLDKLERKKKAIRASMSFALSSICRYSEDYIVYAAKMRGQSRDHNSPPRTDGVEEELMKAAKNVVLPSSALDQLVQFAEYGDPEWTKKAADLMSKLQVIEARLDGDRIGELRFRTSLSRVASDRARDAAKLYGMAIQLFPYAREKVHKTSDLEPVDKETLLRLKRYLGFEPTED